MNIGISTIKMQALLRALSFTSVTLAMTLSSSCQLKRKMVSDVLVTNGREEAGFPYVVQIRIDERGWCTGTFVSDSLLLTAAHCVHRAQKISYGDISTPRENFFIHPKWPAGGDGCTASRLPRYDLALVKFPSRTYRSSAVAVLRDQAPAVDEKLKIVGYGNSEITPFQKFCRLPENRKENGECTVELGERDSATIMSFTSLYSFVPTPESVVGQVGCPTECPTAALRTALEADNTTFQDFVTQKCDGNFRDRGYRESGLGTKRSGDNKILVAAEGVIRFSGVIAGLGDGIDSASGAGDSGGPLFIEHNGQMLQAGVTHGGSVTSVDGRYQKHSIYVDLFDETNRAWLKEVVAANNLKFPQLRPAVTQ